MSMELSLADLGDAAQVAELEAWLSSCPESTPFHRPAWISAVAKGCRQQAIMPVVRSGGEIKGLVPLNLIASRLFGRALVSSGFAVDGGIIADDADCAQFLAEEVWRLAQAHQCPTAELRGGMLPGQGWTLKSDAYLNFTRVLEKDDEAQLLAVPRKHRAEVRKGLGNELDVEIGRDQRLLDIHYRLYAENVHRLGTPVFPKAMMRDVLAAFGDKADIILVSKNGQPLTTIFTLYHGEGNGAACMPYWQGSALAARALRSNEVAYFRLMGHAREQGCVIFDFGRSKVGTGPAAWKKTWGFEGTPLTYAVRSEPGKEARDINPLSPQYQRKVEMWKKLPLPIANLVGPYLARGLG